MKSLERLAEDGIHTVESGFYDVNQKTLASLSRPANISTKSLLHGIRSAKKIPIICEVKFASPSAGQISSKYDRVSQIARQMERGGAVALSVLTEPKNFNGSLFNLVRAREATGLPIIMKDIIVSREQISAASRIGASAVLLIEEVFSGGHTKERLMLTEAIGFAKKVGLEVIVETHTLKGLHTAIDTECDIVGINNRDLMTFNTNIETTFTLLKGLKDLRTSKMILSESGFEKPEEIFKLILSLEVHHCRVPDAFLIGTSIMKSSNIENKVKGFVEALNTH